MEDRLDTVDPASLAPPYRALFEGLRAQVAAQRSSGVSSPGSRSGVVIDVSYQDLILDPGMVRIDGVRFIGATLWIDLALDGKADEIGAHMRASREISDFRGSIQHRGRDFTTGESVERHRSDRAFIERELGEAEREGERAVVITHHAPSPRSVRPWFQGDPFNCAFASDLDRLIERFQPVL